MQEMQEIWVQSLGWDDPLEKEIATHSSILAWRIPWTEELDRLQSMGLQRVQTTTTRGQENWYCDQAISTQAEKREKQQRFRPSINVRSIFYMSALSLGKLTTIATLLVFTVHPTETNPETRTKRAVNSQRKTWWFTSGRRPGKETQRDNVWSELWLSAGREELGGLPEQCAHGVRGLDSAQSMFGKSQRSNKDCG